MCYCSCSGGRDLPCCWCCTCNVCLVLLGVLLRVELRATRVCCHESISYHTTANPPRHPVSCDSLTVLRPTAPPVPPPSHTHHCLIRHARRRQRVRGVGQPPGLPLPQAQAQRQAPPGAVRHRRAGAHVPDTCSWLAAVHIHLRLVPPTHRVLDGCPTAIPCMYTQFPAAALAT